jgi:hypothetical protein
LDELDRHFKRELRANFRIWPGFLTLSILNLRGLVIVPPLFLAHTCLYWMSNVLRYTNTVLVPGDKKLCSFKIDF